MRISHKHRFVFLANPRTGSTTIRNILDGYSDIRSTHITRISKDFPFCHHISARELKNIVDEIGWDWFGYRRFCIVRNPYDRVVSLYHHKQVSSRKVRGKGGVHSLIKYARSRVQMEPTFRDFVMRINSKRGLMISLREFICDERGTFLVDDVLTFEKLNLKLSTYLEQLDIRVTPNEIRRLNASECRKPYTEYYDTVTKGKVESTYSYEISRFGYDFGD